MNRDDFEWLWSISSFYKPGYIPGPSVMPVDEYLWVELEKTQIIGQPTTVYNVEYPKEGILCRAYYDDLKWLYGNDGGSGSIQNYGNTPEEPKIILERPNDRTFLDIFPVSKIKLAYYIAETWNLRPDVRDVSHLLPVLDESEEPYLRDFKVNEPILVGWKDDETPVIITDKTGGHFGLHVVEYLQEKLQVKSLYFIMFGETWLPLSLLRRSKNQGILCLGTLEFLDSDCTPNWDVEYIKLKPSSEIPEYEVRGPLPFNTHRGITWENVLINFPNDEVVQVLINGTVVDTRSFIAMGFRDHRIKEFEKPNESWAILLLLAKLDGNLKWCDSDTYLGLRADKVKKTISILRKKISALFPKVSGKPIKDYRKYTGYTCRFHIKYTGENNLPNCENS